MLEVEGRVVMVSGANRGIDRAVAVGLLAKGYLLSLGARWPEGLADIGRNGAQDRVLAVA
jgi:NADP-dependent 3-hydroxy acid dehydrogenase YdfG